MPMRISASEIYSHPLATLVIKYHEYLPDTEDTLVTIPATEAIRKTKDHAVKHHYRYANDYDALHDFMVVHWAWAELNNT